MKISQKILLGFLFIFVLISLSGVPTWMYYDRILEAFRITIDRDMMGIDLVGEMEKTILEAEAEMMNPHPLSNQERLRSLKEEYRNWNGIYVQLPELLPADLEMQSTLLKLEQASRDWFQEWEKYILSKDVGVRAFPDHVRLRNLYRDLLNRMRQQLYRSYENSVNMVEQSGEQEWTIRVIALMAGLLICLLVIRSVKAPLDRLMHATEAITAGRFETIEPGSRDELGQLTISFNSMSRSLRERTAALEEQRQLAVQSSELKTEFLANTSHELRTPLNTIIGYSQLILDGLARDQDEEMKYLRTIQESSKHLLSLINDVLDIARVEAGRLKLDLEMVSVGETFRYVRDHMQLHAIEKKLDLTMNVGPGVNYVQANPGRLNQILINLIGNAIKFTKQGSVKVFARLMPTGGEVCFDVIDTGIGIAPEKQQRLFKKFVQADGSMTRSYGGTGLGLALSKTLIEMMGGSIEIYSEGEGCGSQVTFYLKTEPGNEVRG